MAERYHRPGQPCWRVLCVGLVTSVEGECVVQLVPQLVALRMLLLQQPAQHSNGTFSFPFSTLSCMDSQHTALTFFSYIQQQAPTSVVALRANTSGRSCCTHASRTNSLNWHRRSHLVAGWHVSCVLGCIQLAARQPLSLSTPAVQRYMVCSQHKQYNQDLISDSVTQP